MMKRLSFWRRAAGAPATDGSPPRMTGWEALHLAVLTTFAVTQPVFDRLGERPVFLSDSGVELPALLVLTASLAFLFPAAVAGLVWGVGRVAPRMRSSVHAVGLFILSVVITLPVVKRLEFLLGWQIIGLALGLGAGATWCYFRFRRCRALVTATAPAIAIFPAVLLFHSPVSTLYFAAPMALPTGHWNPVPVVMVVFDEFCGMTLVNERNEIDGERFPHFAELAAGSTWYRDATTVSPDTWVAVPAILSGKYPSRTNAPLRGDLPQNLFSVLEATGAYNLTIFEPVSRIATPQAENTFLAEKQPVLAQVTAIAPTLALVYLFHLTPGDLQRSLPKIPRLWFGLKDSENVDRTQRHGIFRYNWGDDRNGQFDHFLECLADSPQPGLFFQHVLLPHVPWCYLPSGRKYLTESKQSELLNFDTHNDILHFWGTDELFVAQSQQRYLLQVQYVDRLVGRLLDRLRETGLYDKCLLVVTADHGVCFRINESRRMITSDNLGDILPVPLFIKLPGQQSGNVNDENVESIDILPTIAAVLGIDLKLPIDGQSLLDHGSRERKDKRFITATGLESVSPSIVKSSPVRDELHARFGPAGDREALYRIGPHAELIGQSVRDLSPAGDRPIGLILLQEGTLYGPDPDSLAPVLFEGRVAEPAGFELPISLAVAVNGTIRAVTRTYQLDGVRDHWSAMVPDWAFREGGNDVQYFAVAGTAPGLRLTRCAVIAATPATTPH